MGCQGCLHVRSSPLVPRSSGPTAQYSSRAYDGGIRPAARGGTYSSGGRGSTRFPQRCTQLIVGALSHTPPLHESPQTKRSLPGQSRARIPPEVGLSSTESMIFAAQKYDFFQIGVPASRLLGIVTSTNKRNPRGLRERKSEDAKNTSPTGDDRTRVDARYGGGAGGVGGLHGHQQ